MIDTPSVIPMPWASASSEEIYEVPPSTTEEGRASWSIGFPEVTAKPLGNGGIPPNRLDFQGVLNTISQHLVFLQSGSIYPWNNGLDYLKGARVLGSDGEEYVCQASHEAIEFQDPTTDSTNTKWKKMQFVIGDKMYPVGSIYLTVENVNPGNKFGGTWERISQGSFLIGVDGNKYTTMKTGGAATHTITTDELPSHSHTVTAANGGAHTHTASSSSIDAHSHTITVANSSSFSHTVDITSTGSHTHTRGTMEITGSATLASTGTDSTASGAFSTTNSTTSGDDNNGKSKRTTLSLKASSGWSGSTSSNGSHKHTITVGDHAAHKHTATCSSAGKHSHTITVTECSAHTHTMTVTATGGGSAMSIIPPYYACYMWRRTA